MGFPFAGAWQTQRSRVAPAAEFVAEVLDLDQAGASDGIRTHDLLFTKQLLYP